MRACVPVRHLAIDRRHLLERELAHVGPTVRKPDLCPSLESYERSVLRYFDRAWPRTRYSDVLHSFLATTHAENKVGRMTLTCCAKLSKR